MVFHRIESLSLAPALPLSDEHPLRMLSASFLLVSSAFLFASVSNEGRHPRVLRLPLLFLFISAAVAGRLSDENNQCLEMNEMKRPAFLLLLFILLNSVIRFHSSRR